VVLADVELQCAHALHCLVCHTVVVDAERSVAGERVLAQSRDVVGPLRVRVTAYLAYVAGSVGADTFAGLCCRSLAQRAGYPGRCYRHRDECVALVGGLVNRADESNGVENWGYLGGMARRRLGLTPQFQLPDNHG
jgi:hypothetical protein